LLLLACKPSVIDMGDTAATGDSGVAGPGSGRAGDIQVTPESVAFGEVGVGCGADETVEIANVGDAELEVSSVELTGDASLVLSADAFPLSLAPGESVTVDVSFSPDAEGAAEAALLVASDDPDESLVSATVAGAGTASVVEHEQSWVQTSLHPVELVMALDGSGSMYDDIATLQQSLNALLEVMRAAGTDFRVAAVADDSGCVAGDDPYIHDGHSDEEARAILATMAGVTAGSNAERAFTQLENAWTAADDGFCNDGLFSGDRQVHLFGMSD
ncbi:MAG: choice-of-anchor D domain-containing protein, partial [Proteobacteria bacterium]|nr:choice-of-anchor D domain-containing protein [Pseudomonadota bacterium]